MSYIYIYIYIYMEHLFLMFRDHTWCTTVGRTPLDEWSARRRDLYLTTHDTHNRQISMPPVGFKHTISAGEWPAWCIIVCDLETSRMVLHIYMTLVNDLTLMLLTWRKWWTPNNASKWKMGFNSAFKGLN